MDTRLGVDAWQNVDFRMEASEDSRTFRGYAAVFDSESEDLGGFRETIEPGAFAKTLRERRDDHKAFLNHNWDRLLGSRKAGTLRLKEDNYGLHAEIDLPDTQDGRDVAALTARGDIHAMSFGFVPVRTEQADNGRRQRLLEVKLREVSPVTAWPAYNATTAGVRALAELVQVEESAMSQAFRALTEGELTPEQRDMLMAALDAKTPPPLDTPLRDHLAELVARYD